MGSTSLSLLIVRLVVSHCLMPRFADFGSGVEGGGGDGEPASPLAEKLLTALRVRKIKVRDIIDQSTNRRVLQEIGEVSRII